MRVSMRSTGMTASYLPKPNSFRLVSITVSSLQASAIRLAQRSREPAHLFLERFTVFRADRMHPFHRARES